MLRTLLITIILIVIVIATGVSFLVLDDELNTRLTQYIQLNTYKNWGIRKQLMQVTGQMLSLNHKKGINLVEMDKETIIAGSKVQHSDIAGLLARAERVLEVTSAKQLVHRLKKAKPGDLILIAPGRYEVRERYQVNMGKGADDSPPIVLAAAQFGTVELQMWSVEGLYINSPNWIIRNLSFRGMCSVHGRCQHSIHVFGDADNLIVENNRFVDFNAAIKANGDYSGATAKFADNVKIFNNDFYNTQLRKTNSPASPIDVVGGNNWHIKSNFIADFSRKLKGKQSIVYGAFLKGGGENGIMEDNVVNCAWNLPHQSKLDIRLGLSLGNGGTGKKFCQVKDCTYEHKNGVIRNNLVVNCHNDVSIYLNKAQNTVVADNILLGSLGIDARFPATSVTFTGNRLDGRIKARDGANVTQRQNTIN